jgi:hypothetical protein
MTKKQVGKVCTEARKAKGQDHRDNVESAARMLANPDSLTDTIHDTWTGSFGVGACLALVDLVNATGRANYPAQVAQLACFAWHRAGRRATLAAWHTLTKAQQKATDKAVREMIADLRAGQYTEDGRPNQWPFELGSWEEAAILSTI